MDFSASAVFCIKRLCIRAVRTNWRPDGRTRRQRISRQDLLIYDSNIKFNWPMLQYISSMSVSVYRKLLRAQKRRAARLPKKFSKASQIDTRTEYSQFVNETADLTLGFVRPCKHADISAFDYTDKSETYFQRLSESDNALRTEHRITN